MQTKLTYCALLAFLLLFTSCHKKQPQQTKHLTTGNELIEVNRILVKKDQQRIKNYSERMGWKMTETETGFWYGILSEGSGDNIVNGKLVTIDYTLSLLDGQLCYSSKELGPKEFVVGKGNVESGLEQAILLLKKGTKARIIIPPYLGYGLTGDSKKIPARAILVYEIEVLSVTNPQ
jgi:FKBP-type peptidyl-prolyl cis-trans isomerase FkpA